MPLLPPVTSAVAPVRLHRSSRLFAPGTISLAYMDCATLLLSDVFIVPRSYAMGNVIVEPIADSPVPMAATPIVGSPMT
jgi:hypothetical protein